VELSEFSADKVIVTLTSKMRSSRPYQVELDVSACIEGMGMFLFSNFHPIKNLQFYLPNFILSYDV